MLLADWLRAMFSRGLKYDPAKLAVLDSEERNIQRVAKLTGRTPEQVRQEIRRRTLSVEVDSMRRAK